MDYNYLISIDPLIIDANYNPADHSYIWDLGTIDPNTSGCVQLTVTVNQNAEPGRYLHNLAEMVSNSVVVARAVKDTLVCCWDTNGILYVDQSATGANTGLDWTNAYTDLTDAIERATESICAQAFTIYVAQGTYDPNESWDKSFVLPEGVWMYGGFKPGGCDFYDRNPKQYPTILTGLVDEDAFPDIDTVVTMGQDTLLDGFTVTDCRENAVYGEDVDFSVENCIIKDSYGYGIHAKNGDVAVKWCTIHSNFSDGILHEGNGFILNVDNSWILRNHEYGIRCQNSTPYIKNCIVSESDLAEYGNAGIQLYRPSYPPVLYNNTISNNKAAGIYFEDNEDINGDPNILDYPDIQNCIVYFNNNGSEQLSGINPDQVAAFCCIQDCNEVNFNINDEPKFAYTVDPNGTPDPNNYHLAYDSTCKDMGNPYLTYTGQVDIDGEGTDRRYGAYVDIGADEIYTCDDEYITEEDVFNPLDWNADGVVNYVEFSRFSAAWLCHDPNDPAVQDPNNPVNDPNDPSYIAPNRLIGWYEGKNVCNLDATGSSTYEIDLADLDAFVADTPWLWEACWRDNYLAYYGLSSGGESLMMESMSMEWSAEAAPAEVEPDYADMPITELVSLVSALHEIIDSIDLSIEENHENAENLIEARDFLGSVLSDIQAARQ